MPARCASRVPFAEFGLIGTPDSQPSYSTFSEPENQHEIVEPSGPPGPRDCRHISLARAQAFATARLPDAFSEAADSHVQAKVSSADRATVHADAVTKAHDPLQSLDRRAFYRDQIPAAYSKSRVSFRASASH
jgi:hypothetical protein